MGKEEGNSDDITEADKLLKALGELPQKKIRIKRKKKDK